MKTLKINPSVGFTWKPVLVLVIAVTFIMVGWQALPLLLQQLMPEVGLLDNGIWQLLLFAFISYLIMLGICMLLFTWLLKWFGLPQINTMVSQFKALTSWQQFVLYWASFALLFLGSLLSLAAIF
ncbi:MAG: hypothetical protein EOP54_13770 [Sphingobacteriales bacterium]|nr:MAG: hypothetical protein EOP54_13770 [Sphingobacteriales bacterium]